VEIIKYLFFGYAGFLEKLLSVFFNSDTKGLFPKTET